MDTSPFDTIALDLDFSFSLTQQGIDATELSGLTINPENGERYILDRSGQIFRFGAFGNFLDQYSVELDPQPVFTGLEWGGEERFVLSASDSTIYQFDSETTAADALVSLNPDSTRLESVAFDVETGTTYAINSRGDKQLFVVDSLGAQSTAELSSRLREYEITGLHYFEGLLYVVSPGHSTTPQQAVKIELDLNGGVQRAWSLPQGTPAALLIEGIDAVEIAIVNGGEAASIQFFEAPAAGSQVNGEALEFIEYLPLDFDQPSGIDSTPEQAGLVFITDFAEVFELGEGEEPIELFTIEAGQGSFESISSGNEQLFLLRSDESEGQSSVQVYSASGELADQIPLEVDAGTVFEAMDYGSQSQDLYLVSSNADERKVLLTITDSEQSMTELPEAYGDFSIVGMDLSEDETQLVLVTDEYIEDGELRAGLAIAIELGSFEEQWRFVLAVPGEDESLQGLPAPSGVSVDEEQERIYVTSDVDDAQLAVFEQPD